jgi:TRAP-type mannitol/chloroaromatic compound transport system substrate-binding protein
MKAKTFAVVGVLLLALSLTPIQVGSAQAQSAEVVKWRLPMHHSTSASPVYEHSIMRIINIVKERSGDRFIIEPYLAGALMPGTEIFNAVKRGMVPIGHTTPAYDLAQVPIFNIVAGLPLNFGDVWEAAYFFKWLGFEQMVRDELLAKHGMLYYSDRVYTTELSLKKPVRTVEDFKGMKLRSSGILQKYLTSIGAAASMIPGSDIYTALASGMMDGAHWGAVQGSYAMKFYEINKYHLRPALNVAATDIWLVNKKAFDRLPQDLQQILHDALEEHFWPRTNQYMYQEELMLQKAIREYGVTLLTLPPEEFAKMQAAALKTWDDVAAISPECAKAVEMLKDFNRKMGRIQ